MKKIIPALALLLVSAILMSTAGYAWFSMNTTVEATGMEVTANSNSTFLLIKETGSVTGDGDAAKAANIQESNPISATLTVSAEDASVYPSKPYAAADSTKYTTVAGTATAVTTFATAAASGNWFTANSKDPDKSTDNITGDAVLTDGNFSDYVIKKSVTLTIAEGANSADTLTVTGVIVPKGLVKATGVAAAGKTYYSYAAGVYTKATVETGTTDVSTMYVKDATSGDAGKIDLTAVKVLVVTDDDNITTLDYSTTSAQSLHTVADVTLSDNTIVVVNIYIYYDGSAAIVTSNDKADLGYASISLTFGVAVAG